MPQQTDVAAAAAVFSTPITNFDQSWFFVRTIELSEPIDAEPHVEKSWVTPAFALLNNSLYVAWKGEDYRLNVKLAEEVYNNKYTSDEKTHEAPALEAHNGRLFLAWNGDGNDLLNVGEVNLDKGRPIFVTRLIVLPDASR